MLGILERIGKIRYNDYEKLSSSLDIVLVWWKTSCTEKKKITVLYLSSQDLLCVIADTIQYMSLFRKGPMQ